MHSKSFQLLGGSYGAQDYQQLSILQFFPFYQSKLDWLQFIGVSLQFTNCLSMLQAWVVSIQLESFNLGLYQRLIYSEAQYLASFKTDYHDCRLHAKQNVVLCFDKILQLLSKWSSFWYPPYLLLYNTTWELCFLVDLICIRPPRPKATVRLERHSLLFAKNHQYLRDYRRWSVSTIAIILSWQVPYNSFT